jgi:cbb3-type cytochrome oxidase subunit 3
MHGLLAETGAFGSTCITLVLIVGVIAWVLKKREKERQAEEQRQLQRQYGLPELPSTGRKVAVGIVAQLLGAVVKAWLGHRDHGHHRDHDGW